jgi:hypothetical protein
MKKLFTFPELSNVGVRKYKIYATDKSGYPDTYNATTLAGAKLIKKDLKELGHTKIIIVDRKTGYKIA